MDGERSNCLFLPREQLMSPALVRNDICCVDSLSTKRHRVADVIVYMKQHRCNSLNSNVNNPNREFYIHHQGHRFYNRINRIMESLFYFGRMSKMATLDMLN